MKSVGVFLVVGGILFAAFGVGSFFMIRQWGIDYEARKSKIESGEVERQTLTVHKKKHYRSGTGVNSKIRYRIIFTAPDGEKKSKGVLNKDVWDSLSSGDKLDGYQFGDRYHIPVIDTGGHNWGKWVFLVFGFTPMAIGFLLITIAKYREGTADPAQ